MVSTETWAPPLLRDRFRLWTSQLLIVAGIAGVPFALVPGLFLEYDVTPKLIVLLCSTAGLLLCWQTWLPGAVSLVRTADGRRYAVLVLVAETSLLLSTVFSQNPALSLGGTVWRRLGLITQASLLAFSFLCAACVASDRKYLKIILTAITLTCGGASIYAIAQYAGLDPIILQKFYTTDYYGTLVRVPSTFGHPLYLGAFLAAGVPVGLGSSNFVTGAQRFLLRACSTFAIIALFLTGSRSASIALVVGLAVAFLRLRLPTARQVLGGAAVCAVLAIGVVVFLNLDEGASLRRRLMEWRDDPYGGPRLLVWRDAVAMVPAHIVVGSGLETFASEFRHRQSADLATAFPDSYHESPHNLILDTVISQGALGLAVLVGFASLVLTSATTKSVPLRCLNGSASAALVALCFIPLTITGEMTLYLSLSSLAVLQADPTPRHVVSNTKVNLFAGPLALILLTAAACFLCKDVAFARIADAVEGGRLGDAAATYRLASALPFPSSGDDLWFSHKVAGLARSLTREDASQAWRLAATASARAEHTSDDYADAAYQSAVLAFARNDSSAGESKLRQVIRATPTWYKPHLLLGLFLRVSGRRADAEAEFQKALQLSGKLRAEIEEIINH